MQQKFNEAAHMEHYSQQRGHKADMKHGDKLCHELHGGLSNSHLYKFAPAVQMLQELEVDSLNHYIENANKLFAAVKERSVNETVQPLAFVVWSGDQQRQQ